MKQENYYRIKKIFAPIEELELKEKRGSKFHFPVYMTDKMAQTDIDVLELSVRSYNCLRRVGINTLGDLCERIHRGESLKSIRQCVATSAVEIMDSLFMYQYMQIEPERRGKYLAKVVEMNLKGKHKTEHVFEK